MNNILYRGFAERLIDAMIESGYSARAGSWSRFPVEIEPLRREASAKSLTTARKYLEGSAFPRRYRLERIADAADGRHVRHRDSGVDGVAVRRARRSSRGAPTRRGDDRRRHPAGAGPGHQKIAADRGQGTFGSIGHGWSFMPIVKEVSWPGSRRRLAAWCR
mgnify:CR=1 FL=1